MRIQAIDSIEEEIKAHEFLLYFRAKFFNNPKSDQNCSDYPLPLYYGLQNIPFYSFLVLILLVMCLL